MAAPPRTCPAGVVEGEKKMRRSNWFLVAAVLAGGAPVAHAQYGYVPQTPAPAVPAGPYGYTTVQTPPSDSSSGLSLRQRLANIFHRPRQDAPVMMQPQVPYQSAEPPMAAPPAPRPPQAPQAPAAAPASPAAGAGVTPIGHQEPAAPDEIKKENVLRVAMAEDGSWLIGELHYVHADGGLWVVRYAPLDKEDRYGGAVVLARGPDMSRFREGDLVFVKGSILDEGRASKYVGGPLYRATAIELNERPGGPQGEPVK
jgi:hypothetical protein